MRQLVGRAAISLFLASAAASLTMHACKEPTQVTVDIKTLGFKCQELRKITVVVAADPNAAEAKWQYPQGEVDKCQSDFEVGTLVITPSGGRGAVMVLASYSDEPCKAPDYVNCIVARRQFSFIDNVPLVLPITLEASCKNVPCNALSSCRSGQCVGSSADCNSDGTCTAPAEPIVEADGATVPPPDDATIDIPPNDAYVPPDTYVPPQDVYVPPNDGAPGDGSMPPVDGSSSDAAPPGSGNSCPTSPAGPDCNTLEAGVRCCAEQALLCKSTASCGGGPWFECTGRLHCNGGWCCGAPTIMGSGQTSACTVNAQTNCGSGVYLCNSDMDCPIGLVCQMAPYTTRQNGVIGKCNLPMMSNDL